MNFTKGALALAAAATVALQPCASFAAEKAPPPKGPSAFVRCDGAPNKASTLGTVARLVAITAIIGLLLPEREGPDPKKRESGQAGIDSCNEALTGADAAKDGGRRIELIFGRAIHRMELNDWDGALADIRSVPGDQPELTATVAYKQSLGLTALNLEAMALTGKGDYAGAQDAALRMADAAPYDLINMLHTVDYVRFSDGMSDAKARYLDRFVQAYPMGLRDRAAERAAARNFAGAADDFMAASAMWRSIPKWKDGAYIWDARAAVALRLAGKAAEADALMAKAQKEADADKASGRTGNGDDLADMSSSVDFYAVVQAADEGRALRARTLLSARSGWGNLPDGFVAEMARRLQTVGTPAEQENTPILTAEQVFAKRREASAAVINNPGKDNQDRFNLHREAFGSTSFNAFANNVWKTDKSKYLEKKADEELNATWISTGRNGAGVPGEYAMLLHLALMAKAQGKTGFWILPGQRYTFQHYVRMGSPGEDGMIAPVMFDADTVIADLSPLIPKPVKK